MAAKKLNIKATIVMPTFAPEIKVDAVKRLGANVSALIFQLISGYTQRM